jgi:hypothetical protein
VDTTFDVWGSVWNDEIQDWDTQIDGLSCMYRDVLKGWVVGVGIMNAGPYSITIGGITNPT